MGSEQVNQMFQKHLLEEGHLHYGEFMNDLSRLIVSFFTERILWARVKDHFFNEERKASLIFFPSFFCLFVFSGC